MSSLLQTEWLVDVRFIARSTPYRDLQIRFRSSLKTEVKREANSLLRRYESGWLHRWT